MNRFVHVKRKLFFTALYFLYMGIRVYRGMSCTFVKYLGIPCPGCGMTRAWYAALHLDFVKAFYYHPWFWSVPILYLYILSDGHLFGKEKVDRAVIAVLLGGLAVVFLVRLFVPSLRV